MRALSYDRTVVVDAMRAIVVMRVMARGIHGEFPFDSDTSSRPSVDLPTCALNNSKSPIPTAYDFSATSKMSVWLQSSFSSCMICLQAKIGRNMNS